MTTFEFLERALRAAIQAGHIFPECAACEAALESGWGESRLAREANNLFGQKSGRFTESLPTISIPTREFLHGQFETVPATWPKFYDWTGSFAARMVLLKGAKHSQSVGPCPTCGRFRGEPIYDTALAAANGEDFVREVSRHWSTDLRRAEDVLKTYRAHQADLADILSTTYPNNAQVPVSSTDTEGGSGNRAAASERAGKEDGK
jgi:flagellum-specific peptidoglycan hydrolase FlgJ